MIELFLRELALDCILLGLPIALAIMNREKFAEAIGINAITPQKIFLWFVVSFLALFTATIALSLILGAAGFNDTASVAEALGKIIAVSPLLIAYLFTIRVFAEEVFFRVFLSERLGTVSSAVVFALAHIFYGSVAEVIAAFLLGLVLALVYGKVKNIIPIFFAHMAYNLVMVFGLLH